MKSRNRVRCFLHKNVKYPSFSKIFNTLHQFATTTSDFLFLIVRFYSNFVREGVTCLVTKLQYKGRVGEGTFLRFLAWNQKVSWDQTSQAFAEGDFILIFPPFLQNVALTFGSTGCPPDSGKPCKNTKIERHI